MDHIKNFPYKIGEETFWATDNPDEIIVLNITSYTIKVSDIEKEIEQLENQKIYAESTIEIPENASPDMIGLITRHNYFLPDVHVINTELVAKRDTLAVFKAEPIDIGPIEEPIDTEPIEKPRP